MSDANTLAGSSSTNAEPDRRLMLGHSSPATSERSGAPRVSKKSKTPVVGNGAAAAICAHDGIAFCAIAAGPGPALRSVSALVPACVEPTSFAALQSKRL
jgi:hypothetical protein